MVWYSLKINCTMKLDELEKLCHFTKFETLLLTLDGNRLKFAQYKTMNDI